jgi:DNA polymerase II large subunit
VTQSIHDGMEQAYQLTVFPEHYRLYNQFLLKELNDLHKIASEARSKGLDPSTKIETDIAFDLAGRVDRMFNLPLADRLRDLLAKNRPEFAALQLAEEVALGKFGYMDREQGLNMGVRIGLAVVTECVTVAPIQGISSVEIKKNDDDSNYISVSFAGPIRSAGGTEAAVTIIIADHLRKALGLDPYHVNGWGEDETGRFVEELRIYEREVGNFQYRVTDEDIQYTLSHMTIEVSGVETDPVEVVVHRGMRRIETDRVRGGALRVINDGVIGRSRKLLNLVTNLSITGWEWLANLKGGQKQDSGYGADSSSHFRDVISGRPVLSTPNSIGGFRLRYGRACNTGLSAVGVNPVVSVILDYPFVVGTQAKVNLPGKGAVITFVDSIEPPLVRLIDGSVIRVISVDDAKRVAKKIEKVLHLGDILISYGDFLENNMKLPRSAYVEEWWAEDLSKTIKEKYGSVERCSENISISVDRLQSLFNNPLSIPPSIEEAILLSTRLNLPLHPRYLFYWNNLSASDIILLRQKIEPKSLNVKNCLLTVSADQTVKILLEKAGIPHLVKDDQYIIQGDDAYAVMLTLNLTSKDKQQASDWKDIWELLSSFCGGIPIRNKSAISVGLRIGRPEKAMIRKMKPPVHVLFPVGNNGGSRRDIIHASKNGSIELEMVNMVCSKCGERSLRRVCSNCGGEATLQKLCQNCGREIKGNTCPSCKTNGAFYTSVSFPIRQALDEAVKRIGYRPTPPLKGVKGLSNATKITELLEKGLLRRKYDLFTYKDGTIRFDATNAPLTHFRPKQINTSIEQLKTLGYSKDIYGKPLEDENQILELYVQDIIIPFEAGDFLILVSKFLDELLERLYNLQPYYRFESRKDVLGRLVVGLAPHTSVGIVGRVIGFTNAQVCYAHPFWHSAKRRDCDGDEDAIILLLDVLLNFSKEYLPTQIGGLMDTPLLLQPIIIPKEVQRQAHNLDIAGPYPLEFYEATLNETSPNDLTNVIDVTRSRLGTERQFYDFHFTHDTLTLSIDQERSVYSVLKTLQEKLDKQIELAIKINAVNPDEVVSSVLRTHLLPDIIGNMKAYTSQSFRCKSCGESYRRFPLKGVCTSCGGDLQATVTRGSVEKYLHIALNLSEKFGVNQYLRNRFKLIAEEFESLFPEKETDKEQTNLTQFFEAQPS